MPGNFDGLLKEVRDWSRPATPGQLDIMDFPYLLANRYSVHNVEMQTIHFLSMEPSYYDKFLARLKKANSRMVNMPVQLDPSGFRGIITPCSPDPQIRAHAIDVAKQWIDRVRCLNVPA